jgi:hypothetical protein
MSPRRRKSREFKRILVALFCGGPSLKACAAPLKLKDTTR